MFHSVLVAIDFSPVSEVVARVACDLVRGFGGQLTFLYVQESADATAGAEARLRDLARHARRPPKLLSCPVAHGNVASTVLLQAHEHGADLIVLGSAGRGGHPELGRVAHELACRSPVPVHIVPVTHQTGGWRGVVRP